MTSILSDWLSHADFTKTAQSHFASWLPHPKVIVRLSGPMGAGKTEFVRACIGDQAVSPTFALQQVYPQPREIQHWDLFRLESAAEIEGTGFWDQFDAPEYFVFIEWAEKLVASPLVDLEASPLVDSDAPPLIYQDASLLPRDAHHVLVQIEVDGELRRLKISTVVK